MVMVAHIEEAAMTTKCKIDALTRQFACVVRDGGSRCPLYRNGRYLVLHQGGAAHARSTRPGRGAARQF